VAALEREVAEAFRAIEAPLHHLCGNHDRDFQSVADNETVLGQSLGNITLDIGGWRVVLWRADSRIRRPRGCQAGFVYVIVVSFFPQPEPPAPVRTGR
jgi:hypothetical protein